MSVFLCEYKYLLPRWESFPRRVEQCRWLRLHTINSSQAIAICWCDIFSVKVRCCRCCTMHSSHNCGLSHTAVLCHRLRLHLFFRCDLWDPILKITKSFLLVSTLGLEIAAAAVTICLNQCLNYYLLISLYMTLLSVMHMLHGMDQTIFGFTDLLGKNWHCDGVRNVVSVKNVTLILNYISTFAQRGHTYSSPW